MEKTKAKTKVVSKLKQDAAKKANKASTSVAVRNKAATTNVLTSALRKEVRPLLSDYIRERLMAPVGQNGEPYYKAYVDKFLQDAIEDPSGRCSQQLSSGVFNELLFKTLDSAVAKSGDDPEYQSYRILKTLYKEQKEVYEDPSRYLMCICSRRVGKSELAARLLVEDALHPNHHGLYIAVRFDQAIGIGFKKVTELLDSLKIEYTASKAEGKIVLPNGSDIVFKGNSKRGEADKYQGYLYSLCVVDEVQSQPCLEYLLNSILGAAMVDIKGSRQLLIGTPPRIPNTYCEKLWMMKNNIYSKYNWDMRKNPFLQNDVETEIDIACKKAGVSRDSAFIQREYFGKFVYDTEALIFKNYKTWSGNLNDLPSDFVPTKMWIGVDFGYVDANAITVTAVDYYSKKAYVVYQTSFVKADTIEQENEIQKAYLQAIEFLKRFNIRDPDHFTTIVTDTNQPSLTLHLQRIGLPVISAYKPEVTPTMEQMAAEMRTGRLMIPETGILKDECDRTVWERDDTGNVLPKVDDLTFHPNALHALRYTNIMWLNDPMYLNAEASNVEYLDTSNGPLGYNQEEAPYEVITAEDIKLC